MFKKIVFTFAALAAVCAVAPTALAGTPSPTLDGEQLAAAADGVQTRCSIGLLGVALSHAASGTATGAYSGTFAESGTGRLSMGSLVAFDASFTLATPTGTLKGTMQRVNGRASGSGTCDGTKEDATVDATGIVYTLTLPDGTIDQGIVDLSFSDVPTSAHFSGDVPVHVPRRRRGSRRRRRRARQLPGRPQRRPGRHRPRRDRRRVRSRRRPARVLRRPRRELEGRRDPERARHARRARPHGVLQGRQGRRLHRPGRLRRRRHRAPREDDPRRDRGRPRREGAEDPDRRPLPLTRRLVVRLPVPLGARRRGGRTRRPRGGGRGRRARRPAPGCEPRASRRCARRGRRPSSG